MTPKQESVVAVEDGMDKDIDHEPSRALLASLLQQARPWLPTLSPSRQCVPPYYLSRGQARLVQASVKSGGLATSSRGPTPPPSLQGLPSRFWVGRLTKCISQRCLGVATSSCMLATCKHPASAKMDRGYGGGRGPPQPSAHPLHLALSLLATTAVRCERCCHAFEQRDTKRGGGRAVMLYNRARHNSNEWIHTHTLFCIHF